MQEKTSYVVCHVVHLVARVFLGEVVIALREILIVYANVTALEAWELKCVFLIYLVIIHSFDVFRVLDEFLRKYK